MAVGYIANEKKTCKYFGTGCALFALAGIPYISFQRAPALELLLGTSVFILAGIISIVLSMFISKDEYKVLKKETLLFDYDFLKRLTSEYLSLKKKYVIVASPFHCRSADTRCYCARNFSVDRLSYFRLSCFDSRSVWRYIFRWSNGRI